MNSYNIPRNVKGEGRILYIFSTKALIYTFVGILIGSIFYFIFNLMGMSTLGVIFIILFGAIGFVIATFRVPDTSAFKITRKTGGEKIDDVIIRYIKFKLQKGRIYVYDQNRRQEKVETKEEGGK